MAQIIDKRMYERTLKKIEEDIEYFEDGLYRKEEQRKIMLNEFLKDENRKLEDIELLELTSEEKRTIRLKTRDILNKEVFDKCSYDPFSVI